MRLPTLRSFYDGAGLTLGLFSALQEQEASRDVSDNYLLTLHMIYVN